MRAATRNTLPRARTPREDPEPRATLTRVQSIRGTLGSGTASIADQRARSSGERSTRTRHVRRGPVRASSRRRPRTWPSPRCATTCRRYSCSDASFEHTTLAGLPARVVSCEGECSCGVALHISVRSMHHASHTLRPYRTHERLDQIQRQREYNRRRFTVARHVGHCLQISELHCLWLL